MVITSSQENSKRIVTAPQSSQFFDCTAANIPSTVISVELDRDEEVQWLWTTYSNGQRVVTGYNIIQK